LKVIRILGMVNGMPTDADGSYIADYDAESDKLTVNPNIEYAKKFADLTEAMELWKTTSPTQPVRDDGKPNRPLTVYNIEVTEYQEVTS
jgi:hypothetical protein